MLEGWGYDSKSLWADPDFGTLTCGVETIIQVSVKHTKLDVEYGQGWKDYLQREEWNSMITEAENKLKAVPTKGLGKGDASRGTKAPGKGKAKGSVTE